MLEWKTPGQHPHGDALIAVAMRTTFAIVTHTQPKAHVHLHVILNCHQDDQEEHYLPIGEYVFFENDEGESPVRRAQKRAEELIMAAKVDTN